MSIIAKNDGGNYEPMATGNYVARCYSMVHLGTAMEDVTYKGITKRKEINKIRISWEFPEELTVFKEENGEQPYVISEDYSLFTSENSNLRKTMESWRGKKYTEEEAKEIDVTKVLGFPCMLNVIHKVSGSGKTYAKVGSVTPIPKGLKCPPAVNALFEWNFEDKYDLVALEAMPDFIKDRIKSSNEYKKINDIPLDKEVINEAKELANAAITPEEEDDGLPF